MRVMCLDAGFAHTGWQVYGIGDRSYRKIIDCGCIHTQKSKDKNTSNAEDNFYRSQKTLKELIGVFNRFKYPNNIDAIAVELPHGGAKNATAIKGMAMVSGVIASFCLFAKMKQNVLIHLVTPNEVKEHVRAKGCFPDYQIIEEKGKTKKVKYKITKEIIMKYVKETFDYDFPEKIKDFEHIADSVIVGDHIADKYYS